MVCADGTLCTERGVHREEEKSNELKIPYTGGRFRSAVPSVENFSLHLYALHPNLSVLWVKILLRSAGACPCLLWEYVRCPIGMIFYITAHQSSICLSLLYAKFALPMDMTTIISEVTSPAFPIDMTII